MDPQRFGPATVQYSDYRGTVALDSPDEYNELARLAGIDLDEWWIVGIDINGGYHESRGAVLAVRRGTVHKFEGWKPTAEEFEGGIPVTRFELAVSGVDLLHRFKRWAIHATLSEAIHDQGIDLLIEDEVPPQEPEA